MNSMFMISKNSKPCDKYVALSNLSIKYTWKCMKRHLRTINSKHQPQPEIKNQILYQIFKFISSIH